MPKRKRRKFTPEEKATILRRHLTHPSNTTFDISSAARHSLLFEPSFSAKVASITGSEADDKTAFSLLGKLRFIVNRQPDSLLPDFAPDVRKREDAYQDPQDKILNRANDQPLIPQAPEDEKDLPTTSG